MPTTHSHPASGDSSQGHTPHSLDVAGFLNMQENAKAHALAELKWGKTAGISHLPTMTVSKVPESAPSSSKDSSPSGDASLGTAKPEPPMVPPSIISDGHCTGTPQNKDGEWGSTHWLQKSRSPSPNHSPSHKNTSKHHKTKKSRKHVVSWDSEDSDFSDIQPRQKTKKAKHSSTKAIYKEILQAIHESRTSQAPNDPHRCSTIDTPTSAEAVDPVAPSLPEGNPFITIDQHLSEHLVKLICNDKFVDLSKLTMQSHPN